MKVKDFTSALEEIAPLNYAEGFDNVGLLVGDYNADVTKVLVCLDTTPEVIDEAVREGANLIISFHPIVFSGLKKITGKTYVERTVIKAIQNNINIYATHTALDNSFEGVNRGIVNQLGLKNAKVLIPKENAIKQLITYVPNNDAEKLKKALYAAGAGHIGNYDSCGYIIEGKGNFRPLEGSNPTIGNINTLEEVDETRIEVVVPQHKESNILKALFTNHPYEEVAYSLIALTNKNQYIGLGMVGELEEAIAEVDFIHYVKQKMNTPVIRHSRLLNKEIKKIAVLGGSGAFAIKNALNAGADAYITSDLKYHEFFSAEDQIILMDIGHYESEQFTINLISSYLKEKFSNFVVFNSGIITNPVNYS